MLVPETDTHSSTSKTGWPKCVTTATPSSGKKVSLTSSLRVWQWWKSRLKPEAAALPHSSHVD